MKWYYWILMVIYLSGWFRFYLRYKKEVVKKEFGPNNVRKLFDFLILSLFWFIWDIYIFYFEYKLFKLIEKIVVTKNKDMYKKEGENGNY